MDADLKRAIEESKRQAELEKNRRAAQGHDAQLRAAMEASRREEEARKREIERQRNANNRPTPVAPVVSRPNNYGQPSEAEQLRMALEASKLEEQRRKSVAASSDEQLRRAIEESKKTAKEEEERRMQEEKELNFALQLSAALYRASNVSRQIQDQKATVVGQVQKSYEVPVVGGELRVTIRKAKKLPPLTPKMNPYVVLRIMSIAPVGTLILTIHKGHNIRNVQMLGKQDPYAIVMLDSKKKGSTKVHYDSERKPVWNEKFHISLSGKEKDNSVEIQIWNKNMMKDEVIGYAYIDIGSILTPQTNQWLNITRRRNSKGYSTLEGKILVSWTFVPKGTPSFKTIKRIESNTHRNGNTSPVWNHTLNFPHLMSNTYIQATIRDKKPFQEDNMLGASQVISVQGAIHQNFFSGNQNTWYPLDPSWATKSICSNKNAGDIQIEMKFTNQNHPNGIIPVEVDPVPSLPNAQSPGVVTATVIGEAVPAQGNVVVEPQVVTGVLIDPN
ncbi:hypothetical protein AAMO2058_001260800 [Amorphochlora amoebiformis]